MVREVNGELSAGSHSFGVVVSRFNNLVTSRLLDGALDALRRHGCADERIDLVRVPGAWELPLAAKRLAETGKYQAVICLGCVIRGQTPHFEYVAGTVSRDLSRVGLDTGVPVTFGVITSDTLEQALERAGSKAGNKGAEAAVAAIEMASLFGKL